MIDDLIEVAVAAAIDVGASKVARKNRWIRIMRAAVTLLFLTVIAAGIFVTFKYSPRP